MERHPGKDLRRACCQPVCLPTEDVNQNGGDAPANWRGNEYLAVLVLGKIAPREDLLAQQGKHRPLDRRTRCLKKVEHQIPRGRPIRVHEAQTGIEAMRKAGEGDLALCHGQRIVHDRLSWCHCPRR